MSYSSEVLADSPVAYFRMDETSGFLVQDSSGNANHVIESFGAGTYVNNETSAITSDPSDTSILNSAWDLRTADHATLDLGDVVTMECWFKRGDLNNHFLICKGIGAYAVSVTPDPDNEFSMSSFATAVLANSSIPILADGDFHHLVATKNGSTVRLYVDGVDRTVAASSSTLVNTSVGLSIGSSGVDGGGAGSASGWIDEVAVYATALSAERIYAHWNAGVGESMGTRMRSISWLS